MGRRSGPEQRDHQGRGGQQGQGSAPVAVAKPWTRASVGGPTKSRVAPTATVFSTAGPTLLPICIAALAAASRRRPELSRSDLARAVDAVRKP